MAASRRKGASVVTTRDQDVRNEWRSNLLGGERVGRAIRKEVAFHQFVFVRGEVLLKKTRIAGKSAGSPLTESLRRREKIKLL